MGTTTALTAGEPTSPEPEGPPAIIFEDDFETGDFSKWTVAGERYTVQPDVVYDGNFAVKGVSYSSDTAARFLVYDFPEPLLSVRFTIYFRASATTYNFFMIHRPVYALVPYTGSFKYYDGSYKNLPTSTSYVANQWYKTVIEAYAETNTIKYWIDDHYKGSHQNRVFDDIPGVYILLRDVHPGVDFYVDNVLVENLYSPDVTPLPTQ